MYSLLVHCCVKPLVDYGSTWLLSPYPCIYCFGMIGIHGSIYFTEEWGRKLSQDPHMFAE